MAQFIDDQLHTDSSDILERLFQHVQPSELAKALANIEPDPMTARITRNEIVIALGEFGDIWPEGIRDTAEKAQVIRLHPEKT